MITVLAIGVVAVYLLLLAQLGSFTDPLVIMSSIPLVIIGVAAALIISRKAISMPVLLAYSLGGNSSKQRHYFTGPNQA